MRKPPAVDSIRIPGAPLILTRGEPVRIAVHNRLTTPISMHWHGIELDSYRWRRRFQRRRPAHRADDRAEGLVRRRPARYIAGPGKTSDFAFTPETPGDYGLVVGRSVGGVTTGPTTTVPIRVRAPASRSPGSP